MSSVPSVLVLVAFAKADILTSLFVLLFAVHFAACVSFLLLLRAMVVLFVGTSLFFFVSMVPVFFLLVCPLFLSSVLIPLFYLFCIILLHVSCPCLLSLLSHIPGLFSCTLVL